MSILVKCSCGYRTRVKDEHAGKTIRCPTCGKKVAVSPPQKDGAAAPLVAIATGFLDPSENPKTGPMVQVYVIREDMNPAEAVATGASKSVCNDCALQPWLVRQVKAAAVCQQRLASVTKTRFVPGHGAVRG